MLEFLRKASQSWAVKLLLVGIALSFMSWGVGDMVNRAPGRPPAITVGDVNVYVEQLATELNREVFRLRPLFGEDFTTETAIKVGLHNNVIKQSVSRAVLDMNAMDMGVVATDEQVRKAVYSRPEFQDNNNRFQKMIFEHALSRSNWTEDAFLNAVRGDIRREHISGSFIKGIVAPQILIQYLYRYRAEKRTADTVLIKQSDIKIKKKPDSKFIEKYYEDNKNTFMREESRTIAAIILSPKTVSDEIPVSEEEIKTMYENNMDSYVSPEKRKVEQMLFKTEEKATEARVKLDKGEKFHSVAKEMLNQSEEATDLGWLSKNTATSGLAESIFKVAKGTVAGPVKSEFGWHIFRVAEIKESEKREFADVREEIITAIKSEQSYEIIYKISNQIEDALAGGAKLEEAAEAAGIKPIIIESMDINGLDAKGSPVLPDFMSKDFLETAFSSNEGEESPLVETDKGSFILRTDKITPPSVKPLKEVKDEIINIWKQQEQNRLAMEKADKLLKAIEKGQNLEKAAKKAGLKVEKSKAVTRFEKDRLSPSVVAKMFSVAKGKAFMLPAREGFIIAKVTDIIEPNPAKDRKGVMKVTNDIRSSMSDDITSEYITAQGIKYGVTINHKIINEVF